MTKQSDPNFCSLLQVQNRTPDGASTGLKGSPPSAAALPMRTLNSAGGSNHQKMEPEVKQELRAKVTDAMSQVNQEKKTAANLAKSIKQRIASPEAEPKAKARARGKAKAKAKAGSNGDGDEEAAKSRKGKKGKGEPSTEPTKPTDSGNKKRGRAAPKPKAKARVSKKAKAWFVFAL